MTFATVKDKQGSERWTMARLTVARDLTSYLSVVSGSLRSVPWTHPVTKIELNGALCTEDTSVPSVDGHWFWDEAAGVLYLHSTTPSSSYMPVVFFYLFTTSGNAVDAYQDPANSATPVRAWEPRLTENPRIRMSMSDLLSGVFTIEDTRLALENASGWFNEFCAATDSINEKDVDLWIGVRTTTADTPAYQRVYRGRAKRLTLSRQDVSIEVHDVFASLRRAAYMGDTEAESYFTSSRFADLDPAKEGLPCRFITGGSSRYTTGLSGDFMSVGVTQWFLAMDDMEKAVCTSSAQASTSANRTWGLCRIPGSVPTINVGAIARATLVGSNYLLKVASTANIMPGDTVRATSSGHYRSGIVQYVGSFSYLGNAYDLIVGFVTGDNGSNFTTAFVGADTKSMVLVLTRDYQFLHYTRDYTLVETSTSGGNKYLSIVLANNFEANFAIAAIDPATDVLAFRVSNGTPYKHGTLLQEFCEQAGLEVAASSFSDADTALPVNTCMSIPYFDELDYGTYLDYAERLLFSTLGFLSTDASAAARYDLVAAPTSSDDTGDEVALPSDGIRVDYQDIVSQIIAYNPHNASQYATTQSPSPSETRDNPAALYLHGVRNVDRMVHVLETITDRIDDIMAARAARRNVYSISVAAKYLDGRLGQDFRLTTSMLLGSDTQRAVKTTFIDISAEDVTVEATDLEGL